MVLNIRSKVIQSQLGLIWLLVSVWLWNFKPFNFSNKMNDSLSKSAKIVLPKSIFYVKNQRIFTYFFYYFILKYVPSKESRDQALSTNLISFLKKDLLLFTFLKTCFHFQTEFRNKLPFSKCDSFSKGVFIFKIWKVSWVFFSLFRKTQL